jgi:hypothetical protein
MPNGVLRNKLGITDRRLLAEAEADITRARLISPNAPYPARTTSVTSRRSMPRSSATSTRGQASYAP